MKRVLIISPYFPPSNAADMQRVRMSLPYFKELGWEVEVVSVEEKHSDVVKDYLLLLSVPVGILVHRVDAFTKKWTSKVGLGSIALRSIWFYKRCVNGLLKDKKFDLIYFSTTQFPVCILGAYWKRKFNIPYVIDIQDPWFSQYYQDKPRRERPPKYWFAYRLNKFLEPIAMKDVDGLISVSTSYLNTLQERYPVIKNIPTATITFGAFNKDFEILNERQEEVLPVIHTDKSRLSLVYIGRGGYDLIDALDKLFRAFKKGVSQEPELFEKFFFFFIGTSYAPKGEGKPTILPVANKYNLGEYVSEQTDRIPFFQGLRSLQVADGFIIPGSNDPGYTASKLYPYILAQKPLLGIFHERSSAVGIIQSCKAGDVLTLQTADQIVFDELRDFLFKIYSKSWVVRTDWKAFEPHSAKEMCRRQVKLFEKILK